MNKYLKILTASFVFVLALGAFAQTASALRYVTLSHDGLGRCFYKVVSVWVEPDGTLGTNTIIREGTSQSDGGCKLDTAREIRGTLPYQGVEPINPSGGVNPADPFDNTTPKFGDKNSDAVRSIQEVLSSSGISVTIDGNFGPRTQRGIKTFQMQSGIPQTGLFDSATRALMETRLMDAVIQNPPVENAPVDTVSLKEDVSAITKIKNEVTSLKARLSSLAQQASVIESLLKGR